MALECNIDAKGKAVRLIGGIFSLVAGLVSVVFAATGIVDQQLGWLVSGGLIFGGAFAIFEARAGWCVVRALGFKTPL
ncbi:MAG: hypothetical protein VYB50_03375 [Candidatus Thermoplasmatota archaeon]|nr:hypothetical protein [Candidatus Thermoplasmatota archaeon]